MSLPKLGGLSKKCKKKSHSRLVVGRVYHTELFPPEHVTNNFSWNRSLIKARLPHSAVRILREDGSEASRGELGRIVCKLPMAPGTMTTMFGADERFRETYFQNFKVTQKPL